MSKLLSIPFGLDLDKSNVDQFLYNKISKKLDYQSTMKLSLAGRVVINLQPSVIVHTLVLHHNMGGSNKILGKVRDAICNYLWSRKEQFTCMRVSWKECYEIDYRRLIWVMLQFMQGDCRKSQGILRERPLVLDTHCFNHDYTIRVARANYFQDKFSNPQLISLVIVPFHPIWLQTWSFRGQRH